MSDDIYSPRETDNELQAQIRESLALLKKQSDEYWSDPASKTCGVGFPHIVGGKSFKIVDIGTFMVCIECGQAVEVRGEP